MASIIEGLARGNERIEKKKVSKVFEMQLESIQKGLVDGSGDALYIFAGVNFVMFNYDSGRIVTGPVYVARNIVVFPTQVRAKTEFYVAPSKIPGAGQGLFSVLPPSQGDLYKQLRYGGIEMEGDMLQAIYGSIESPYVIQKKHGGPYSMLDASVFRGGAALLNHSRDAPYVFAGEESKSGNSISSIVLEERYEVPQEPYQEMLVDYAPGNEVPDFSQWKYLEVLAHKPLPSIRSYHVESSFRSAIRSEFIVGGMNQPKKNLVNRVKERTEKRVAKWGRSIGSGIGGKRKKPDSRRNRGRNMKKAAPESKVAAPGVIALPLEIADVQTLPVKPVTDEEFQAALGLGGGYVVVDNNFSEQSEAFDAAGLVDSLLAFNDDEIIPDLLL